MRTASRRQPDSVKHPCGFPQSGFFSGSIFSVAKCTGFDPARGEDNVIAGGFAENLACLLRLSDGSVLLVTATEFHCLDPGTGTTNRIAAPLEPPEGTCFNDGKVAPDGALWLGISDADEVEPTGSLHRINASGVECVDRGLVIANGPAFSPDGRHAYFADSVGRDKIQRYSLDREGKPGRATTFATLPEEDGLPDGMTTDVRGHLYSAHWQGGRISVYKPNGQIEEIIRLPAANITSCAFGGEDLSLLFATSAAIEESDGNGISARGRLSPVRTRKWNAGARVGSGLAFLIPPSASQVPFDAAPARQFEVELSPLFLGIFGGHQSHRFWAFKLIFNTFNLEAAI